MHETNELGVAIFLVAKGWSIRGIRREGRFCYFSFDPDAETVAQGYWNNDPVPIQTVLSATRIVRGRMRTS